MSINIQEEWDIMSKLSIKAFRELLERANDFLQKRIADGKIGEAEADKVKATIEAGREQLGKGAEVSLSAIKKNAEWLVDWIKNSGDGTAVGTRLFSKIGKVTGASNAMPSLTDQGAGAVAVAGGALAALLLLGAYKTYKNKYSEAAKACSKYKGEEKDDCMKKFRVEALRKQLQELQSSVSKCNKSKDSEACKKKVNEKIIKLRKQLMDLTR